MSHTPGPWLRESEINDEGSDWIVVTKGYEEIVDLRLEDGLVVSEQEQAANAALICAAPDLLAALIRMRDEFNSYADCPSKCDAVSMAFQAIKKAGGE